MVSIDSVPVFRPTWEEFKDFNSYISAIEEKGAHHCGICKIIPPPEWLPRSISYSSLANDVVTHPQIQKVTGSDGLYEYIRDDSKPKMTVQQFRRLASSPKHRTPFNTSWENLEEQFWASIKTAEAVYGADNNGSVMDSELKEWNISHLGSILDAGLKASDVAIEGVNTPYLYFGMWQSFFGWHVEDMDLYSINYIHIGMPKQWYTIPPLFARRFEAFAREYYKSDYMKCASFLRHKLCLISPSILNKAGIPVNKMIHCAGEIVITFPYGYHAGYNTGFNLAESTNFALPRWIEIGMRAIPCNCRPHSVKFGLAPFVKTFYPERYATWQQGEDTTPHPIEEYASAEWQARAQQLTRERLKPDVVTVAAMENGHPDSSSNEDDEASREEGEGIEQDNHSVSPDVAATPTRTKLGTKRRSRSGRIVKKQHTVQVETLRKKFRVLGAKWNASKGVPEFMDRYPNLWYSQEVNMNTVKEYNALIGQYAPHCAVCSILWSPSRVSRVLAGDTLPDPKPLESEPLIPEPAYARHHSLGGVVTLPPRNSRILECRLCRLSVHARCYGRVDVDTDTGVEVDDWLCDRCRVADTAAADCCMCPVRGGAFKQVSSGHWAHIVCLLGSFDVTFTDIPGRQARFPALNAMHWSVQTCYCCGLLVPPWPTGGPHITSSSKQQQHLLLHRPLARCVFTKCRSQVHITCAQFSGLLLESVNHPWYFFVTCPLHYKIYKSSSKDAADVKEGDDVYAKCPRKKRYLPGRVIKLFRPRYYTVSFEDGSFSNDITDRYLVDYDFEANGYPQIGSTVTILWDDGLKYDVKVLSTTDEKWTIELANKVTIKQLSRERFYKVSESRIPSMVLRHVNEFLSNPTDEDVNTNSVAYTISDNSNMVTSTNTVTENMNTNASTDSKNVNNASLNAFTISESTTSIAFTVCENTTSIAPTNICENTATIAPTFSEKIDVIPD